MEPGQRDRWLIYLIDETGEQSNAAQRELRFDVKEMLDNFYEHLKNH